MCMELQNLHSSVRAGDIESAIKADIDIHAAKAMKDKDKFIKSVLNRMKERMEEEELQNRTDAYVEALRENAEITEEKEPEYAEEQSS